MFDTQRFEPTGGGGFGCKTTSPLWTPTFPTGVSGNQPTWPFEVVCSAGRSPQMPTETRKQALPLLRVLNAVLRTFATMEEMGSQMQIC